MDLEVFGGTGEATLWGLGWSADGNMLATCGHDHIVRIHKRQDTGWILADELKGAHEKTIRAVAFSPNSRLLAAASFDGKISIWGRYNDGWECLASLDGHENEVKSVCWSPDGTLLASCGRDKTVWLWLVSLLSDGPNKMELDCECVAVMAEHSQDVKMVRFHPWNSHLLVSASYDETMRVWATDPQGEEDEWINVQVLKDHKSTVWACDFDATGEFLFSCGHDKAILVWKREKGLKYAVIARLEDAHARPIASLSVRKEEFSILEDQELTVKDIVFATASGDRSIALWSFSPLTALICLIERIQMPNHIELNCIVWNPKDGTELAAVGDKGFMAIVKCDCSQSRKCK